MDIKAIRLLFITSISLIIIENVNSKLEITKNEFGSIDDYSYEFWRENDVGTAIMTFENKNKFNCSWDSIYDIIFTVGKEIKKDKSLDKINLDNITVNYDIDFTTDGKAYIGVNGYFGEYYSEYFIVDNWGEWRPIYGESLGTISVDDGVYDIYYNEKFVPPNIHGIQKTLEYWSTRREKRSKGIVSVGEHFKAWQKKGLELNNVHSVSFRVQAFKSNGNAIVNNMEININEK